MKKSIRIRDTIIGILLIVFGLAQLTIGIYLLVVGNLWGIGFLVLFVLLCLFGAIALINVFMGRPSSSFLKKN